MHDYWRSAVLFRIILPCVIAGAGFVRPTVTSCIYMFMGSYIPFFSVPTNKTMAGATGTYLKLLIMTSLLTCSLVSTFYFVIYFSYAEEYQLEPCSPLETMLRTLGVVHFSDLPVRDALTWILPEPVMLLTSMLMYFGFQKFTRSTEILSVVEERTLVEVVNRKKLVKMLLDFGKLLVCAMLGLTAILKATVFGGIYYVVFLAVMTYWACNQSLGKLYARILVFLIPIFYMHITILFVYQFQYFQDSTVFETTSLWGRLFNLVDLKTYKDCKDPRMFKFHAQSNVTYALPSCLFFLYQASVLVARSILEAEDGVLNLVGAFFRRESTMDFYMQWRAALKKIKEENELEKISEAGHTLMADRIHTLVDQISTVLLSIAYVAANFAMMVWAIAYIGWVSLIMLMWANLIWLLPNRKKIMLIMSPLLVIMVLFLLLTTYLYLMDLSKEELPPNLGTLDLTAGIANYQKRNQKEWLELLIKSLLGVIILINMRQFWQERAKRKRERELARSLGDDVSQIVLAMELAIWESSFMYHLQKSCIKFLALWWIWIVIITMVWMDFWSTSNLFRIAFVVLAILFLLTFQLCPFKYWKKFLWVYWWIVIIYAMFNLLVLYMYQLENTRKMLHRYFSAEESERYGFTYWTDTRERFLALANPLFFQIAIVMQQNYFQKEFNKITSPEEFARQERDNFEEDSKWSNILKSYNKAKHILFAVLEIHLQNIILLIGWFMCLFDLCALFVPFTLLFTVACVLGRTFTRIVNYTVSCLVQVLIILRLVYMNQVRNHHEWDYVGHYTRNGKPYNVTLNTADWLGFHESRYGRDYADFRQLQWCFGFVVAVTIARIVRIRMKSYRLARNLQEPQLGVAFPEITYKNCHTSTKRMLMYLANYGFYKFGCEITFIYASIVMGIRMDAISIPLSFFLLKMFALNRAWLKRFWLVYMILLALEVPAQYVITLGWWPTFFDKSWTQFWNSNDFLLRFQQFCHLMNMAHPPAKEKISWDFMLLLIMSRQWLVFMRENKPNYREQAGSNENISYLIDNPDVQNPVPDFITYTKSSLDSYKRIIFNGWFYLSLTAIFLAGSMRPTIYSLGYILGSFVFLGEGSDMFLRPSKEILFRWNVLIAYNIAVMMIRTISQIFGCILKYEKSVNINCVLYRFFTIGCVDKYGMTKGVPNLSETSSCRVYYSALGLGWDCFCFFCLICQQRIFKSFHFFHIVNEVKARTIFADRGAELIENIRRKKRQAIDDETNIIERNIKKKMERIEANAEKIEDIRAGDYTYFEQVERDIDIPLLPPEETVDEEEEIYDPMPLKDYFGLFFHTNISTVLEITRLRRRMKKDVMLKYSSRNLLKTPSRSTAAGSSRNLDKPKTLSRTMKFLNILEFVWGGFESFIVSLTGLINRRSKSFRSILDEINKEIKILKEKTNYTQGVRLGLNKIWHPSKSYKNEVLSQQRKSAKEDVIIEHYIYTKLVRAIWDLVMAYSEWLCYFVTILDQTLRSNFLSLPLSIMVFCWGALTVPIPSKTFWVVTNSYVLILVFLRNFFNIVEMPWDMDAHEYNIFFPPSAVGLFELSTVLNLSLLFAFFFNRIVLQILGIYKPFNYRTVSLIKDDDYIFKDGKLVLDATKNPQALTVKSTEIPLGDYFPQSVLHGLEKYAEGVRLFIQQIVSPKSIQIPVDVYTPMFLCDLVNLLLIVFSYGSFLDDPNSSGLVGFIIDNTVPTTFILAVLIYTFFMTIDRGLYLRRNRYGKLVFYFFQVVACHMWFFVLFPLMTNKRFSDVLVVQTFYILKCLYFLFSAYQIRNGYPILISYHCLWRGYTIFNRFGYTVFRTIPYFIEMRLLLDWICSDSCLAIPPWFKLEDITQNLFTQKCKSQADKNSRRPSGQRQNRTKKYIIGGILFVMLVLTLIFPLLLFSMSSTVGVPTRPKKIRMELYMGGAEPIFKSYVSEKDEKVFSKEDFMNLTLSFNKVVSKGSLDLFQPEDVIVAKWSGHSLTTWDISPGSKQELLEELRTSEEFSIRIHIHITHIGHGGEPHPAVFEQSTHIPPLPSIHRQNLIDIIQSDEDSNSVVWLPLIFPKFLMITKESEPVVLSLMENPGGEDIEETTVDEEDGELPADPKRLRNLLAKLRSNPSDRWWQIKEECDDGDDNYYYYLKNLVHNGCDELTIYIFNEKVFSSIVQYATEGGIIGLYLIYFMVILELIEDCQPDIGTIWVEKLPNPDKVYRKCMEIYVARDFKNFALEGEIFEELICIMRSREMLIKLTRYRDNNYDPMFSAK